MEFLIPSKIQVTSILVTLVFLVYVFRLIIKGKLREEYSIIWVISAFVLLIFSFWRQGLALLAELLGVYSPPNMIFMIAFFAVMLYLLHLSVVVSKLQENNKAMAQKTALLLRELQEMKEKTPRQSNESTEKTDKTNENTHRS